jgi:phage minor tail protein G
MSMFLKKDEFTHNGASVPITELSALQRITYLEYLAAEEKALSAISITWMTRQCPPGWSA